MAKVARYIDHPAEVPFDPRQWDSAPPSNSRVFSRIQKIIEGHPLPDVSRRDCMQLLAGILHRQSDQRLYLAVAGEFSAGKSTFINALLREKLLDSDVNEGTTVVPTFIEYKPTNVMDRARMLFGKKAKKSVELHFSRPGSKNFSTTIQSGESQHQALSGRLGASFDATMRNAQATRIGVAAESISDGLVIIDTPGVNSSQPEHLEATRQSIERWADAVAVLTQASQPLPVSLCSFIRENLGNALSRCILVASHIDTVRPRQRDQQLAYIHDRFTQEFGVPPLAVLGAAPLIVVLNASNRREDREEVDSFGKSAAGLLEEFSQTEKRLRGILAGEKRRLIDERIQKLRQVLLSSLEQHLGSLEKQGSRALDMARARRPEELAAFTKRQRDKYIGHFRDEVGRVRLEITTRLSSELSGVEAGMQQAIDQCRKPTELGALLRKSPPQTRRREIINLAHHLFSEMVRGQSNLCLKLFEQYRGDLAKSYPGLQLKASGRKLTLPKTSISCSMLEKEYKAATKPIVDFGNGIGITFLTNWFGSRSIAELRSEGTTIVRSSVGGLSKQWEQALGGLSESIGRHLASELDLLAAFYEQKASAGVAQIRARHRATESALGGSLMTVRQDLEWVRQGMESGLGHGCSTIQGSADGVTSPPPMPAGEGGGSGTAKKGPTPPLPS